MRGLRAPSTAGCGRAGASSSRSRSGSAPGASCVTMDIWLLAAPSSHSERPPQRQQPGSSASAQVTAGQRQQRWQQPPPPPSLMSPLLGRGRGGRRGKAGSALPRGRFWFPPTNQAVRVLHAGEATAVFNMYGLLSPLESLAFQFSEVDDSLPIDLEDRG